jgi:general secretion pathway protein I
VTALFVFSVAAVAVLELSVQNARALGQLESSVYARIVADNQMALALGARIPPPRGEASGEEQLAGRAWEWRRVVDATVDPDIDRVEIVVREAGEDRVAATLLGFRGRR